MLFWSIVPLLAATLAQDAQFTRESNGYWKRTTSGVVVTAPQSRLRVMTHGRIVLRGSAGDQVTYRLVERVKALPWLLKPLLAGPRKSIPWWH